MNRLPRTLLLLCTLVVGSRPAPAQTAPVQRLDTIPAATRTSLYVSNREPLAPSPLVKLPIGSITPRGWLRRMLEIERDGMTGHLKEISPWLNFEKSSWADPQGRGHYGWEEMPYWLKGYGDLGYVLKDPAIIAEARRWIEAAMASQREDGYFGPREMLTALDTKTPDMWPHMLMLNAMQSYHEATGDKRVLDTMTRYFHWQDGLPPEDFGAGYWPQVRMGDNIESIYWLYNRTGDAFLLGLATKIFDHSARWDKDVINWHNVNVAQGFRTPAIYWMQTRQPGLLAGAERNYEKVMGLYGQFPGGGFAGDENCRPGYGDPRQGFETCGMVEFMHSFEMLTKIAGAPAWADRCEDVAFNSFPASMSADQRALHYLTSANMVQLDHGNKAPGIGNSGTMFSYSPFEVYRCCQHNHSHGWPYYAEELWLGTGDGGLCASLYAASEVTARVADGRQVNIAEETAYPFGESVNLKVTFPDPAAGSGGDAGVSFPLYLRVPGWCQGMKVSVNREPASADPGKGAGYLRIDRAWKSGDVVAVSLPMEVQVRHWQKNKDSVSVNRGPITYALKIDETRKPYGDHKSDWAEYDVYAGSPWNYGLVFDDPANEAKAFQVVSNDHPGDGLPFTPETAPLELKAKARRIDAWQQDKTGLLLPLQASPARTSEPVEQVSLIPMGAARLRISAFPTASDAPGAHEWVTPAQPKPLPYKPSASFCCPTDTVDALCDGALLQASADESIPRMTWWDHQGTSEWVQYDLGSVTQVSGVSVYWFDDTGTGRCRVPQSWKVMYQQDGQWLPVTLGGANLTYGTVLDQFNVVSFAPVRTSALRVQVELQPGSSGGILEWQVR